jgi:hypothetical protein
LIDFKLVADGVTDDSPLIEQWWNIGGTLIGYEAEVAYSGAGLAESSLTKNLKLMGNGLVINCTNASSQYYFILIDVAPSSTAKYITVKGISINANSKFAYGVRIQGDAAAPAVSLVEVSGCTVQALDNANLGTITTCAGIQVSCNSSNTQIKENFINDVTRTQVNPGFASSVGIIATNVTSILNIENNNIRSISSPTGDADADGIVVFGVNTGDIPAVRQQLLPTIHGNKITQCKGRFVKLQCANGKVYNNFMESLNIEMITNFRGIDAQIGGCQIYGNFIRLKDSVSLESASFVNISSRENGGLENIYLVHDNEFLLEGAMAYAVTISADENTDTSIKIRDNDIKSADPSNVSVTNMCLLGLPENADRFSLTVTGNEIPLKNGQMFFATSATAANWTDATKGPIMSDFVSIIATENHNTHPDVNTDIFNPSNVIPYVQDIVIRGNKGFDRASLYLKGFDAFKAPDGNQFYFATDGSTGGVINAPAGLNRDVVVETMGYNTVKLTKFTGTSFAIAAQSIGTWSTYTGT